MYKQDYCNNYIVKLPKYIHAYTIYRFTVSPAMKHPDKKRTDFTASFVEVNVIANSCKSVTFLLSFFINV